MSLSKAFKFSPSEQHFSIICKALSHPARLVIMKNILNNDQIASFRQLKKDIPLDASTIAQHLKILRDMKIIEIIQKRSQALYRLNFTVENTIVGIIALTRMSQIEENKSYVKEISAIDRRNGVIVSENES